MTAEIIQHPSTPSTPENVLRAATRLEGLRNVVVMYERDDGTFEFVTSKISSGSLAQHAVILMHLVGALVSRQVT